MEYVIVTPRFDLQATAIARYHRPPKTAPAQGHSQAQVQESRRALRLRCASLQLALGLPSDLLKVVQHGIGAGHWQKYTCMPPRWWRVLP